MGLIITGYNASAMGLKPIVCTSAADTPYGVTWTKDGVTITGTLVASSSTKGKLYFVKASTSAKNNYDEYMTLLSGQSYVWECVGHDVTVDLSAYRTSAAQDTIDATKQDKLTEGTGIDITTTASYKWNTQNYGVAYTKVIPSASSTSAVAYVDAECTQASSYFGSIDYSDGSFVCMKSGVISGSATRDTSGDTPKDTIRLDSDAQASLAGSERMARDFGRYASPVNVTLSQAVAGKYVDKDTALEVSNAAYGISAPISLAMGDILLIPSASAVLAACSVVSQKITNTYAKVIIYTYTYDANGRIATATADYDSSLVYTAHYPSDESSTPDYWTISGSQVETLPSTHSVTESHYVALVKQSVAAMPDEGYYVFLASQAMDVVISGFTATVNGGIAIKTGWGLFKNIASNFVGIEKQRVIAEAIAANAMAIASIEDKLSHGIDKLSVRHLTVERELSGLNANGTFCLRAAGVPSASLVPDNWNFDKYGDWTGAPQFIGQEYFDSSNNVFYKGKGVDSVSDWSRITNA